jgi:hypothetical protein
MDNFTCCLFRPCFLTLCWQAWIHVACWIQNTLSLSIGSWFKFNVLKSLWHRSFEFETSRKNIPLLAPPALAINNHPHVQCNAAAKWELHQFTPSPQCTCTPICTTIGNGSGWETSRKVANMLGGFTSLLQIQWNIRFFASVFPSRLLQYLFYYQEKNIAERKGSNADTMNYSPHQGWMDIPPIKIYISNRTTRNHHKNNNNSSRSSSNNNTALWGIVVEQQQQQQQQQQSQYFLCFISHSFLGIHSNWFSKWYTVR